MSRQEHAASRRAAAARSSSASARPSPSAEFSSLKPRIIRILRRHGVSRAGIFGSFARGEQKKKSDVDILVETHKGTSLFDFVGIKLDLEDALKKKVDLVEYGAIKPLLRDHILADEVRIL